MKKSITICICAQVFGINAGMLLLTNRLSVSFLWEPFPSWVGNYQTEIRMLPHTEIHMLPHTDLLPLPTLPALFSYPWCWTWEAFLMDQVLGEICCLRFFFSFLKFCTLCWMYFFSQLFWSHQFRYWILLLANCAFLFLN